LEGEALNFSTGKYNFRCILSPPEITTGVPISPSPHITAVVYAWIVGAQLVDVVIILDVTDTSEQEFKCSVHRGSLYKALRGHDINVVTIADAGYKQGSLIINHGGISPKMLFRCR